MTLFEIHRLVLSGNWRSNDNFNLNCKFHDLILENLCFIERNEALLNFSLHFTILFLPFYTIYILYIHFKSQITKPIIKRIRISNSPPKILLFLNARKKKEEVACFRPEKRETTLVVRSRPVKMAGRGEKGKGSTSVCIVHDLVLDRKQKFPAYVCDPLFLWLARGNSFPVKRRRDFEIAPCDFSSASCNPFHSHRSSLHSTFLVLSPFLSLSPPLPFNLFSKRFRS